MKFAQYFRPATALIDLRARLPNLEHHAAAAPVAPHWPQQVIRLLEQEVRLGYWPHWEFDWTEAARTAGELAAEHSLKMVVRGMDLFHVAIAIETAADAFLSFDDEQIALAEAAGLALIRLRAPTR